MSATSKPKLMQNKICLLTTCFASALVFRSYAQTPSLSKLEIAKGDTYVVEPRNQLFVDTLIMHEKATIVFNPALYGVLEAKAAYIGKKCTITSKGKDGKNGTGNKPGEDGADGGNLTLTLHFEELIDLTIDTRGGNGGKGANGRNGRGGTKGTRETVTTSAAKGNKIIAIVYKPGRPGTPGSDATSGGNGGNGGNSMLVYSVTGFIPIFNSRRGRNNITLLYYAGKDGVAGNPAVGGNNSYNGSVPYKEHKPAHHGNIRVINKDAEVAQSDSIQVPVPSNQDANEQLPE